jgi:preprotein translocase subunit SecG
MIFVLLVIHIMVAIALIGVVLLQKSEGGALGIGGGGMSGFMTGRSTANLLTRATAILAAVFFTTSVLLVVMHNRARAPVSIIDQGPTAPARPVIPAAPTIPSAPAAPTGSTPAAPAKPGAPAAPAPGTPSVPLAH